MEIPDVLVVTRPTWRSHNAPAATCTLRCVRSARRGRGSWPSRAATGDGRRRLAAGARGAPSGARPRGPRLEARRRGAIADFNAEHGDRGLRALGAAAAEAGSPGRIRHWTKAPSPQRSRLARGTDPAGMVSLGPVSRTARLHRRTREPVAATSNSWTAIRRPCRRSRACPLGHARLPNTTTLRVGPRGRRRHHRPREPEALHLAVRLVWSGGRLRRREYATGCRRRTSARAAAVKRLADVELDVVRELLLEAVSVGHVGAVSS